MSVCSGNNTPKDGDGDDSNDCVPCDQTSTNLKYLDGDKGCAASCTGDGESPNSDGICAACGEDDGGNQLYADHAANTCVRKFDCPKQSAVVDDDNDCGNK